MTAETYRPVKEWSLWHAWVERGTDRVMRPVGVCPDVDAALEAARDLFGPSVLQVVETIERAA